MPRLRISKLLKRFEQKVQKVVKKRITHLCLMAKYCINQRTHAQADYLLITKLRSKWAIWITWINWKIFWQINKHQEFLVLYFMKFSWYQPPYWSILELKNGNNLLSFNEKIYTFAARRSRYFRWIKICKQLLHKNQLERIRRFQILNWDIFFLIVLFFAVNSFQLRCNEIKGSWSYFQIKHKKTIIIKWDLQLPWQP